MQNIGGFASKGLSSQFKTCIDSDQGILSAFSAFGTQLNIPEAIHQQMERYVCHLYGTKDVRGQSLSEIRWTLFAQKGKECRQLPPTKATFLPHTPRAYYASITWKRSTEPMPEMPPATDFCWEEVDGHLSPVPCT